MIQYKDTHDISPEDLQQLFLSVSWSSGSYPDRLAAAMRGFETVFTAWDGDKLTGLISAMDDHSMTAYIHFLLVRPDYQGQGIGRRLVEMTKEKYSGFLRIVLVAYDKQIGFYERCVFVKEKDDSPMFITELST